ncbi:SGM_5486 family transporter-associated protein [Streptomyces sp. ICBB 8177]|nr:SGM_5486 family transporter-associated protein [Streptomyces sp. ICBB 8177]
MPVLEPNPPQPQKKLLLVFGLMLGVPALVAVIATIGSHFG